MLKEIILGLQTKQPYIETYSPSTPNHTFLAMFIDMQHDVIMGAKQLDDGTYSFDLYPGKRGVLHISYNDGDIQIHHNREELTRYDIRFVMEYILNGREAADNVPKVFRNNKKKSE